MIQFIKKLSLVPKGMRYKLLISFSLMSLIPLWVIAYFFITYLFPTLDNLAYESMAILFTILIAYLGLILARRLVEPVIDMALEAKIIAGGDYSREVKVDGIDEIGDLGNAINQMTTRIRDNLEELSSYGERTKEINFEIHKKVIALSNLLQVGDAITASKMSLAEILALVSEKVAQTHDTGYTLLLRWENEDEKAMTVAAFHSLPEEKFANLRIGRSETFLMNIVREPKIYVFDETKKPPDEIRSFINEHDLKNLVALPITPRGKLAGVFIVGNKLGDFAYKEDDIELYKVFVKQIAIAIENDYLLNKTKELSITDDLTGLYNKKYITSRLEEEIRRSILFQRPCSFMVVSVDEFDKLRTSRDAILIEKALKRLAMTLREFSTEIGKVARTGSSEFALLLPEVNKRAATKMAEDLRKRVEETFSKKEKPEDIEKITVSIGVSENPIDGATANELTEKANKALGIAKASGKNKVVARI